MSHVVAGATMAIVRVSFLREASQVEPSALRWVQFFVCFLPLGASFTCFVHSHTVKAEGGGSEGELREFSSFCERVPRC